MKQTFEEFLEYTFDKYNVGIKDNYEADMDRWFSNLDVQDIIDWAEDW